MSGWKKLHNYLIAGLASLAISTALNAAVMTPQLDVQNGTGTISGDLSMVNINNADVLGIILGGGGFVDFIPNEPFALSSTAGSGSLQVGAGGSLLTASFSNLAVVDLGAGNGVVQADLTYTGGSLAGGLTGGRMEGGFVFASGNISDFTAKIGPVVVPVPAAMWLFGSGLLGLIAVARRKIS